jgi:hypothetical protein
MAERRGTGGQGGTGAAAVDDFSMDDFAVIPQGDARELSRSRVAPSKVQPLIDLARDNLGQKIEWTVPVMENGEAKRDEETGRVIREPRVYTKAEAEAFSADLRNAANRNKLPARRLSLRIVTEPPLAKAKDTDKIKVQFYIVGRSPNEPQPA